MTAAISNNVIVANNEAGAQGIGAGTSSTLAAARNPQLEVTITGNTISATDGNGILVTARDATGTCPRESPEQHRRGAPGGQPERHSG